MPISELASALGLELLKRNAISISVYVVFAGLGYLLFYVWKYRVWFFRKIQQKNADTAHIRHEIVWSLLTRVLFGFMVVAVLQFTDNTALYYSISDYGWTYFVLVTIGVILLHDTYFYWIHRWMHHPRFYRLMHRIHHNSTNPTPFAAFAFHPTEAIVEAAIFPVLVFLLPMHPVTLVIVLLFQTTFNVYGHSGFELAPRWWVSNRFFKYINTSVHHNYHHKEFNYNFGLYFNYWDRWLGTLDPQYNEKFYAVKDRVPEQEKTTQTTAFE